MNKATASKINWTAMAGASIGLACATNLVPPEWEAPLLEFVTIVMFPLIAVFRTWFTGPKP